MRTLSLALGALALAASPVVAQSLPTVAPVEDESRLSGTTGIIAALAGAAAIVVAIILIEDDDDDDDDPVSP